VLVDLFNRLIKLVWVVVLVSVVIGAMASVYEWLARMLRAKRFRSEVRQGFGLISADTRDIYHGMQPRSYRILCLEGEFVLDFITPEDRSQKVSLTAGQTVDINSQRITIAHIYGGVGKGYYLRLEETDSANTQHPCGYKNGGA